MFTALTQPSKRKSQAIFVSGLHVRILETACVRRPSMSSFYRPQVVFRHGVLQDDVRESVFIIGKKNYSRRKRTILYTIVPRHVTTSLSACNNIIRTKGIRSRGQRDWYNGRSVVFESGDDRAEGMDEAFV
jgi:hypothetical protein